MYNRRYDKIFIMLRQELNGFSMGQQPAWGSCVVELKNKKGKLFVTVQGLKKLNDDRKYEFFIIGGKGNAMRGISCGNIFVDQYGKGELKWEFQPDAIGQSCFCVEELHTAALMVKGTYGLTVPLVGYFQEKVYWQKHFQEEKLDLRAAEAVLADIPQKEESIKKQIVETNEILQKEATKTIKQQKPIQQKIKKENLITIKEAKKEKIQLPETQPQEKKESNFEKNFKNMLCQFKKELQELEEKGILSVEEKKQITQAGEKNTQTEVKKEQCSEREEITYILNHNDNIYPFAENDVWKTIALEELILMPFDSLKMMHHGFFIVAYRKYKHFIFQKTLQGEYVIGIPDQYQPQTRREAEQLSFSSFQPCKNETMKAGCYGYWLRKMKTK